MLLALLTLACAGLLAGTLIAEHKGLAPLKYVCKPLASVTFLAVAAQSGAVGASGDLYARLIFAGLFFGAVGDVALMFAGNRAFLIGLVTFLVGHVLYVVAFGLLAPPETWPGGWSLLPFGAAAIVLFYLWPHLGSMRVPVIAYVAAIVLMVVAAIAVRQSVANAGAAAPLAPGHATLVLVGACLFFVSDIAVARAKFVVDRFVDRLWGLPAYYAGQLCIAASLMGYHGLA